LVEQQGAIRVELGVECGVEGDFVGLLGVISEEVVEAVEVDGFGDFVSLAQLQQGVCGEVASCDDDGCLGAWLDAGGEDEFGVDPAGGAEDDGCGDVV